MGNVQQESLTSYTVVLFLNTFFIIRISFNCQVYEHICRFGKLMNIYYQNHNVGEYDIQIEGAAGVLIEVKSLTTYYHE